MIDKLAKPFGDPFKIGFSQSMDSVFLVGACVVVVAVVVLAFLPHVELRDSSPLEQQQADDNKAAAKAATAAEAAPTEAADAGQPRT